MKKIMLILTLLLSGRAMTLAFIGSAGSTTPGAPPDAWLMPLLGDAIIGLSALWVAYLIWQRTGLWVWMTIMIWNALAIWDALSAYIIHLTNPWPTFFMIEIFGASMFFLASLMHLIIIWLAWQPAMKAYFLGTGFPVSVKS
ncbi:MAG: hypothetical protein AAF614_14920 [Chloroflexota bacterium]